MTALETKHPVDHSLGRHARAHTFLYAVGELATRSIGAIALALMLLVPVFLLVQAWPLFLEGGGVAGLSLWDLVLPRQWPGYDGPSYVWQPLGTEPKYNVVPLVAGTLKVTWTCMLISVPVALGAAIYVSHYAAPRVRTWLRPCVELLAALPTTVLGFFALTYLATWVQRAAGTPHRLNAGVAALAASLTVIPVIFTVSEHALSAVPHMVKDASRALGARTWQTVIRASLPTAAPAIVASILLGFGRALGETMIALMVSGNAPIVDVLNPGLSARTVTASLASEMGEVPFHSEHWRVLFALALALYTATLFLNILGAKLVARLRLVQPSGPGA